MIVIVVVVETIDIVMGEEKLIFATIMVIILTNLHRIKKRKREEYI